MFKFTTPVRTDAAAAAPTFAPPVISSAPGEPSRFVGQAPSQGDATWGSHPPELVRPAPLPGVEDFDVGRFSENDPAWRIGGGAVPAPQVNAANAETAHSESPGLEGEPFPIMGHPDPAPEVPGLSPGEQKSTAIDWRKDVHDDPSPAMNDLESVAFASVAPGHPAAVAAVAYGAARIGGGADASYGESVDMPLEPVQSVPTLGREVYIDGQHSESGTAPESQSRRSDIPTINGR
jgi:hypothetical protein